ncbi:MAG: pilus assembly protein PilZ [Legionellaceae bacterium]|nr:pilus assembly protein PilZ [Legionellaceae bacterium]HCA88841.1 PilZ domain-containing protein [Legionellales bacterium]|tara:strand:+ start:988 stop:1539 length:552 start_codon:yes stop_codon:yes gene_type:complete
MPIYERRQHFRIDDTLYFNYKILKNHTDTSDTLHQELLGTTGQFYQETLKLFESLNQQLTKLNQNISSKMPEISQCLHIMNTKLDYLTKYLLFDKPIHLETVNISLGGMAFKTTQKIKKHAAIKIVLYTKPDLIPILIDACVVYSRPLHQHLFQTAVQFKYLSSIHEQLLSRHIMLAETNTNE